MSVMHACDACGEVIRNYSEPSNRAIIPFVGSTDREVIDLCPECLKDLRTFLGKELFYRIPEGGGKGGE